MHASRGMDEKWLIVYPKMNDIIVSLALTLFSWWPLIFHFPVTSLLRHHHLQRVCSFLPPLLHNTCFVQYESLCNLHVAPAIFAQLFSFLYFAIFLWDHCDVAFNPTYIFNRSKLWVSHHAMRNNLGYYGRWLTSLPERRNQGGEILTIPTLK